MGSLEEVPGAGLILTDEYEIVGANDRCQIVFKTDVETIRGRTLSDLRRDGVLDGEAVTAWREAVDETLEQAVETSTEQVNLTPFESDQTHHYRLEVEPHDQQAVCCSLRSSGTEKHYVETITALHSATRELIQADRIDEVLHRTAEAASDVLGFPGTAVRRYDPETETLRHVAFGSQVENLDTRPPYPVEDSPHGRAFEKGETVIDDIDEPDPYDREVFTQTMYVPIGEVGLLSVGTVGTEFDEVDVDFAEILGDNATAAVEIVETTESLRAERERLDLLERILSRVLRHNIRNEMTIIRANAETLRRQTDRSEGNIDTIIEEADQVIDLSAKARQLEKIVSEPFSHRTLDLRTEIDSAVRSTAKRYPDATIETIVDGSPAVSAHESLHVAIENLLENACEHADCTPEITVEATATAETVVVRVLDNGPGIPPGEIEAIDSRAETALEHPSGLGLWIVEWIVDRSGGEIRFNVDDGTTVDLELTRAPDGRG
jgi:signal transduction histidine kinase